MPCFTVTLFNRNTLYQLSDMIARQYDVDPAAFPVAASSLVASSWPQINIQADYDNPTLDGQGSPIYIKYGCVNLSGIRYGKKLQAGDYFEISLPGGKFVSTAGRYFMCENADNMQLCVELTGS